MQCILCEKPSAAKNYASALGGFRGRFNGKEYQIVNSVGHIFSFLTPEKQVPENLIDKYKNWDIANLPWNYNDFYFKKELTEGFEETFEKIKDVASKCDEFVIATDDDPTGEGTLLANEIIEALNLKGVHYYRSFHVDESPKEIQKAMKNLKDLGFDPKQDPDYKKADFRSKWDYLSMQWTRVFTKLGDGRSVLRQGRLKSYMVWAVGEQIRLNQEYKKVPFYENRFKDENGNVFSWEDEPKFPNKNDVPNTYHDSDVVVTKKEMKHSSPPSLYDLSLLSASLAPKGFDSKTVLNTYQKMYENHIVSYPRTEDKTITPEQFNDFLAIADKVADLLNIDKSLLTHRVPRKTHVKAIGSHGANRPSSNVPVSLEQLEKGYGKCGVAIYEFLGKNSLAMLCEDYEYLHEEGKLKDYPNFTGSVNIPQKMGFKAIFNEEDENDEGKHLGSRAKPFIYEGFPPKPAWPTAKWLANLLKKNDVGTGATRTSIYAEVTNQKSKFPLLSEKKGKIDITEYGNMSYKLLRNTHIGDVKLTERLQEQMREVGGGKDPLPYLNNVAIYIKEDIETVKSNTKKEKFGNSVVCPKCGNPMQESVGYLYCNEYKKTCDFILPKVYVGANFTMKDVAALKEGTEEKSFTSKEGKKFKASLVYENGKFRFNFNNGETQENIICQCGQHPVKRTGKYDTYYKCACGNTVGENVYGKKLTKSQIKQLFAGKTIWVENLTGKSGKTFSANLILKDHKITIKSFEKE